MEIRKENKGVEDKVQLLNNTEVVSPCFPCDSALGGQGYVLGAKSRAALSGVHPDLVRVVEAAIRLTKQDFTVLQGLRTKEQQAKLVASGNSWTTASRHLTGHAVDVAPHPVDWKDLTKFERIRDAFFQAAGELGIPIRWGGDWNSNGSHLDEIQRGTYDGGHFELLRSVYP